MLVKRSVVFFSKQHIVKLGKTGISQISSSSLLSLFSAWKVSVLGGILAHIFPHLGWIRSDTRIQSKCGKMRTRITPNTDTFYAVIVSNIIIAVKLFVEQNLFNFLGEYFRCQG